MASSDEEGELVPDCVTDYYFVDHKDDAVSFSDLPLTWNDENIPDWSTTQIFLRGTVDSGIGVLYKKVISWKFVLSYVVPEFYVLSKEKSWINLQQPKKSFLSMINTLFVTVHCLHYIKRNSEASEDDMWNYLHKTLSSLEVVPSKSDLLAHKQLIMEALNKDKDIAKSEYLSTLFLDMREECTTSNEQVNHTAKKSSFIVADKDIDGDNGSDSDEDMLFDSVCSFCDNGGDILCCEGRCMRSFHPTEEAGVETSCASLGYTDAQVEAMKTFLCENCKHQQHQCFACGLLGSSNISSNAEVFPCVSATCGRFYHSKCVSKLLHPGVELQAKEHEMKIANGDSFICPMHTCFTCKQGEERKVHDLQFALCRRCPKAYHRKCLPRTIVFEEDGLKGIQQRAWDDLLPQRILIYCMDHKIIPHLGTPYRNHIVFPGVGGKQQHHGKHLPPVERKKLADNSLSKKLTERDRMQMEFKSKKADVMPGGYSSKKTEKGFSFQSSRKTSNMNPQVKVSKPSIAEKKYSYLRKDEPAPSLRSKINLYDKTKKSTVVREKGPTIPLVEAETETRMMALIKRATASFDEKEYIKKRKLLSGNSHNDMSYIVEKTITLGKVQASVKAVQAACKMLKGGCSTREAKAVCEPQVLRQISKWKNNLSCYLSPFLNGMRYTSFGRHFTKVDKLKEIVDRLHWYVQEDDMVVDFCCGSNDFSLLLKEKLQQMGKRCSYKNYDLIQSKNDFNYEKRDWMTVRPDELPTGSQLIMGLNPPFGIQGVQASKFVTKALSFRPKLLILIVPEETKRPDTENKYDLIWKDSVLLAGKSFYLPGSVDVNDQQLEQWNRQAPPLYLWSRQDWTYKHKKIAQKHDHIYDNIYGHHKPRKDTENIEPAVSNYLMEETQDCFGDFSHIVNNCGDISRILDDIPENCGYSEGEGSRTSMQNEELKIPVAGCWLYDQNSSSYYLEPSNRHEDEDGNVGQIEIPQEDVQARVANGWKYDQNMNSYYLEPQNIEDEGNENVAQIHELVVGNLGGGDSFEEGEMCTDMELSTPPNSS